MTSSKRKRKQKSSSSDSEEVSSKTIKNDSKTKDSPTNSLENTVNIPWKTSIATISSIETIQLPREIVAINLANLKSLTRPEMEKLKKCGLKELFPVQWILLPLVMNQFVENLQMERLSSPVHVSPNFPRDVLLSSPTGSGKTLAYLLPILILTSRRLLKRFRTLILVPTRDLANQTGKIVMEYSEKFGIKTVILGGGESLNRESRQLEGVEIIVATPGRLMHHSKNFNLNDFEFLIVDEADRLLGQEFGNWQSLLPSIVAKNPIKGETSRRVLKIFCSATMSRDPGVLARLGLINPVFVVASSMPREGGEDVQVDENSSFMVLPPTLNQKCILVSHSQHKPHILVALLKEYPKRPCLIFTKSIESSLRLFQLLKAYGQKSGWKEQVVNLSGQMNDDQRRSILKSLGTTSTICITTDLMARGISLSIPLVINYNLPSNLESYIHRSGRTARAGQTGNVITLVDHQQWKWWKANIGQGVKRIRVEYENDLVDESIVVLGRMVRGQRDEVSRRSEDESSDGESSGSESGSSSSSSSSSSSTSSSSSEEPEPASSTNVQHAQSTIQLPSSIWNGLKRFQ